MASNGFFRRIAILFLYWEKSSIESVRGVLKHRYLLLFLFFFFSWRIGSRQGVEKKINPKLQNPNGLWIVPKLQLCKPWVCVCVLFVRVKERPTTLENGWMVQHVHVQLGKTCARLDYCSWWNLKTRSYFMARKITLNICFWFFGFFRRYFGLGGG
jgi:hypothetical protein